MINEWEDLTSEEMLFIFRKQLNLPASKYGYELKVIHSFEITMGDGGVVGAHLLYSEDGFEDDEIEIDRSSDQAEDLEMDTAWDINGLLGTYTDKIV